MNIQQYKVQYNSTKQYKVHFKFRLQNFWSINILLTECQRPNHFSLCDIENVFSTDKQTGAMHLSNIFPPTHATHTYMETNIFSPWLVFSLFLPCAFLKVAISMDYLQIMVINFKAYVCISSLLKNHLFYVTFRSVLCTVSTTQPNIIMKIGV